MLKMKLLENEASRQRIWIISLSILIVAIIVCSFIFWRNKRKYINLRKELDSMLLTQIINEAGSDDGTDSFAIIKERAELCVEHFRKSGMLKMIQKGEDSYNADNSFLPIKDRAVLRQQLFETFSDFIFDLKIDAGKLTVEDIITALLSLMRVSNAAIASCLGVTDGAVRTRKTRLKSKFSKEMSELVFG